MTTPPTTTALPDRYRKAADTQTVSCNYCKKPIVWAETKEGRVPFDAQPEQHATSIITTEDGRTLTAVDLKHLSTRRAYAAQGYALYAIHRLSCIKASEWTKPRGAAPMARAKPTRRRPR